MLVTALSTIQAQFLSAKLPCKMIHFHLRMLENAFLRVQFQKFFKGACPCNPLEAWPLPLCHRLTPLGNMIFIPPPPQKSQAFSSGGRGTD